MRGGMPGRCGCSSFRIHPTSTPGSLSTSRRAGRGFLRTLRNLLAAPSRKRETKVLLLSPCAGREGPTSRVSARDSSSLSCCNPKGSPAPSSPCKPPKAGMPRPRKDNGDGWHRGAEGQGLVLHLSSALRLSDGQNSPQT